MDASRFGAAAPTTTAGLLPATPDGRQKTCFPTSGRATARLRVREFAPEEITPFHAACLNAIVDNGIPHTTDLNDMDENVGAALSPVNIWNGIRWNASFAYLDPVRDKKGLTIVGDALVDKINVDRSRATSVDVVHAGEKVTVEAGRVVLCAGAYGSPVVLLRSGIGPSDDLAQARYLHPELICPVLGPTCTTTLAST